jgi:hypothetical protein
MAKAAAKNNNHELREIKLTLDKLAIALVEIKVDLAVLISKEGDVQDKLTQIVKDVDHIMRLVRARGDTK